MPRDRYEIEQVGCVESSKRTGLSGDVCMVRFEDSTHPTWFSAGTSAVGCVTSSGHTMIEVTDFYWCVSKTSRTLWHYVPQYSFAVLLGLVRFGESDAAEGIAEMLAEVCSIETREASATTILFAQYRQ